MLEIVFLETLYHRLHPLMPKLKTELKMNQSPSTQITVPHAPHAHDFVSLPLPSFFRTESSAVRALV